MAVHVYVGMKNLQLGQPPPIYASFSYIHTLSDCAARPNPMEMMSEGWKKGKKERWRKTGTQIEETQPRA